MKLIKNKIFIFWLVSIVLSAGTGYFFASNYLNAQSQNTPPSTSSVFSNFTEFHAGGYKMINPLYECNTGSPYGTTQLLDLNNNINDYINQLTLSNSVTRVAVYFKDLNNGPWFGINEHDDFSPSSLLKTPVMMAYFKEAEEDPSILNKKIKNDLPAGQVLIQDFQPKHPIEVGKVYTVEELIEHMIEGSDNAALRLLEENIDNDKIDQVTKDLGITTATSTTPQDFMDVTEYSTLFRVLYYSTYLNRDYSEKALEILSKVEFDQGLVTKLPQNITVAHKFGERELADGTHQLHDCGIIYFPKHSYLLCIMTKGPKFNDLESTIQQISAKVYSEVAKIYP